MGAASFAYGMSAQRGWERARAYAMLLTSQDDKGENLRNDQVDQCMTRNAFRRLSHGDTVGRSPPCARTLE